MKSLPLFLEIAKPWNGSVRHLKRQLHRSSRWWLLRPYRDVNPTHHRPVLLGKSEKNTWTRHWQHFAHGFNFNQMVDKGFQQVCHGFDYTTRTTRVQVGFANYWENGMPALRDLTEASGHGKHMRAESYLLVRIRNIQIHAFWCMKRDL